MIRMVIVAIRIIQEAHCGTILVHLQKPDKLEGVNQPSLSSTIPGINQYMGGLKIPIRLKTNLTDTEKLEYYKYVICDDFPRELSSRVKSDRYISSNIQRE